MLEGILSRSPLEVDGQPQGVQHRRQLSGYLSLSLGRPRLYGSQTSIRPIHTIVATLHFVFLIRLRRLDAPFYNPLNGVLFCPELALH